MAIFQEHDHGPNLEPPTAASAVRRHSLQSSSAPVATEQPEPTSESQRSSLSGGFAALKDALKEVRLPTDSILLPFIP